MDDLDSDWDTEEFQAALKTVLKCEIQSLLERLSKTGEESVLLAVNTVDMCASHLASSNAQKFVNSADVGQVKMKFLQYVTGHPGNVLSYQKPLVKADQDSGAYSDSEINSQGKWTGSSAAAKQPLKRGQEFTQHDLQGSLNKRQKLDPTQNQSAPQIQAQKAANIMKPTAALAGVQGKNMETVGKIPGRSDGDNTREKSSQDQLHGVNKAKLDIKLNTTKIVSKSGGFTEERLSDKEFKNLLKMCNSDVEEEEEEEDEEYIEAGGVQLPSKLSFLLQGKQSPQARQSAQVAPVTQRGAAILSATPVRPTGLIMPPRTTTTTSTLVTNRPNMDIRLRGQPQGQPQIRPDFKSELDKDNVSQVNKYKVGGVDGGSIKQVPTNTLIRDGDPIRIKINPILHTEIKEERDPNDTEYQQNDPNKARAGLDKQTDKQAGQEKENRTDGTVLQKDVKQTTQKQAMSVQQRPQIDEEPDTETLIKMAKAKHKESESDADKAIQAKLGQLSSKLSWVVEYPKEEKDSWKSQQQSQQQKVPIQANQGFMNVKGYPGQMGLETVLGLEDEEEEDYDEEEFEDELDEEELAALRAYQEKQMRVGGVQGEYPAGVGRGMGQFTGEQGQGGYQGEYGEEEEDYGEDYDYDEEGEEMEDGGMDHMGNYIHQSEMGSQMESQPGMGQVQGPAAPQPHFANFRPYGPIMAKCLICNKLIRKTEMQKHNQQHIKEAEEEDDNYEEMGEDENWEEEGEDEEGIDGNYEDMGEGEHWGEEEEGAMEGDQGEGEEYMNQGAEFDQQGHEYGNEGEGLEQDGENLHVAHPAEGFDQQMQDYEHPEGEGGEHEGEESFSQGDKDNAVVSEQQETSAEFTAEKVVPEKVETNTDSDEKLKRTCDICNKEFKSVGNMQRHRKIHTNLSNHPCPICQKNFKQASYLTVHIRKKHPDYKGEEAKDGGTEKSSESAIGMEETSLKEQTET